MWKSTRNGGKYLNLAENGDDNYDDSAFDNDDDQDKERNFMAYDSFDCL